jgi:hypothetical protein
MRITRRDSLFFGGLGSLLLAQPHLSAAGPVSDRSFGRAKRCVLIWLDGGPSHLETFDPKPAAAAEIRGPLRAISTQLPGVSFGEGLPQLAQRADRLLIVRSMTSPVGEHNLATQYALAGHIPGGRSPAAAFMFPAAAEQLRSTPPLPSHVAIPNLRLGGGAGLLGPYGPEAMPWETQTDADKPDLSDRMLANGGLAIPRLQRRRALLDRSQDAMATGLTVSGLPPTDSSTAALQQAIDLLVDPQVREAFSMERESLATRGRYGGKPIGQNCLLARRLLERGVPLVTVSNFGWDTHDRLHERLHAGYAGAVQPVGLIPALDQAVAALLDDLQASGLLQETLVVIMGEFGRTPKMNTQGGRDHWARAYSVLLAGAGLTVGRCYGSSDRHGETVNEHPVSPADLVATLYHLLGLNPFEYVPTKDGQQLRRVALGANVVRDWLA